MRFRLLALCALQMSAEASAQSVYGPPPLGARVPRVATSPASAPALPSTVRDTQEIRRDIRHGRDSGALSKRDSRHLHREADQIDTLADRYGADGLSDSESRELDSRTRALRDITNGQRIMGPGAKSGAPPFPSPRR